MSDVIVNVLRTVTPEEARAILEALDQFVENGEEEELLASEDGRPAPEHLNAARAILERLNGARASLAA
jgi:hypothetical protein